MRKCFFILTKGDFLFSKILSIFFFFFDVINMSTRLSPLYIASKSFFGKLSKGDTIICFSEEGHLWNEKDDWIKNQIEMLCHVRLSFFAPKFSDWLFFLFEKSYGGLPPEARQNQAELIQFSREWIWSSDCEWCNWNGIKFKYQTNHLLNHSQIWWNQNTTSHQIRNQTNCWKSWKIWISFSWRSSHLVILIHSFEKSDFLNLNFYLVLIKKIYS